MPETWFFRDRDAFAALARLANEEWLRKPGRRPVPPEPAVLDRRRALFDGDGAARRRHPRAPLSHRRGGHQLAHSGAGRAGVYGRNSFRGDDLEFRDRYFDVPADGYRVSETVRQQVRFQQGNLFAAGLLPGRRCTT